MREWQSYAHVKHYCRYHIVCAPKHRKKAIYEVPKKERGGIFRDFFRQYAVELIEGHAMADHIYMLLTIPPKHSVSHTVSFLEGKSAIRILREYQKVKRNFTGRHFWARRYCVSTLG